MTVADGRAQARTMRWIATLILSLVGCGLEILGLLAVSRTLGAPPQGTGVETEPSPCVSEATIRVTISPSKITLGRSSVLSWSVNLPNRCPAVRVKLNGESVATKGSRSVSPSQTTAYTVVVSETRLGVHAEKSGWAKVDVGYPPRVIIDRNTRDPIGV